MSKILVTSALPYANGPVHFGHVAGAYLPADIFVRYQRAAGREVLYICGSDEHGAPITANAARAGESPEDFTRRWHGEILNTFSRIGIEFDNFSRTSRAPHHELSKQFFLHCQEGGYLEKQTTAQPYCTHDEMFLPDRYLTGTCPKCGYEKARGDECPKCGHWIESGTLIDPRCKLCETPAVDRETTHWYLDLGKLQPQLEAWLEPLRPGWKPNVLAQVDAWLKDKDEDGTIRGLRPRCITRDLDWGVKVPLEGAEGKVLYVWFDAPIGYISSTIEWARERGTPDAWRDWWQGEDVRLVHFIGKDNIVFHCLTWPAVLMCQPEPWVKPENVPANEFYNLQGAKFSTSEGWYLDIDDVFSKYPADMVRYVIARGAPETADSEWRWEDFQVKVNSELNDTLGNLANRCLAFLVKHGGGEVPAPGPLGPRDREMLDELAGWPAKVGELLEAYKVRAGVQQWMELARRANKYVDDKKPWKARKDDPEDFRTTMAVTCRVVAGLAVMGRPFVPDAAATLWSQLGFDPAGLAAVRWADAGAVEVPAGQALRDVRPLFRKITDEEVAAELAAMDERKAAMTAEEGAPEAAIEYEERAAEATFDDFIKVDLRAGVVVEAEEMKKSKKLLKLQVDLGFERRQILAGLKEFYSAEELVGRRVAVVANLAPRKMMGEMSQGMCLATTDAKTGAAVLVDPGADAVPGSRIT